MTVREILRIGNPVLRERSREVTREELASAGTQRLIDDLIDTLRAANGAGLAAPQVGELVRIVTIEVGDNPRYPYKPTIPLTVVVNPVIEVLEGELIDINEGCLSVPDLRGNVARHSTIRVTWWDRDGREREAIETGLSAGTWQHECDHLDGVLFVDRVRDTRTLATWTEWERHHRDAWLASLPVPYAR